MAISYVGQLLSGNGVFDGSFPAGGVTHQTITLPGTLPITPQLNDLIVLAVAIESADIATSPAASDSRGNTYTLLGHHLDASLNNGIAFIAAPMTTLLQGGDTITVNMASSVPAIVVPVVFRGVGVTPDGTYQVTNDGFASAWSTPSLTPTAQPELALSMAMVSSTVTTFTDTPSAGWTDIAAFSGSNTPRAVVFQYQITASTSALSGGGTFKSAGTATNESFDSQLVVLQASAGGSTPLPLSAPVVSQAVNRSLFY